MKTKMGFEMEMEANIIVDEHADMAIKLEMKKETGEKYKRKIKLFLPSVFISQNASTGIPGFIEDIQYLPLGDLPSLILISFRTRLLVQRWSLVELRLKN